MIDAENYLNFDDKRFNCILFASYIKKKLFFLILKLLKEYMVTQNLIF